MPDIRRHRGAHPGDRDVFGPQQRPRLRAAASELNWLLDHGYALRSSLALVGDRHRLSERQRLGLARSSCSAADQAGRAGRCIACTALRGLDVWIDGYNLLISLEAALGGGVILRARDECCRDLSSLHGTYRTVVETLPAVELAGTALAEWEVLRCRWFLDRPVSNSGRLRELMLETAASRGWPWDVQLEFNPDAVLSAAESVVVSSDSLVLDRCRRWANVAAEIISARVSDAFVVDLRPQ